MVSCAQNYSKKQHHVAKFLAEGIQIVNCLNGQSFWPVLSAVELDSKSEPDLFCVQRKEMDADVLATCQKPRGAHHKQSAEFTSIVYGANGVFSVIALVNAMVE